MKMFDELANLSWLQVDGLFKGLGLDELLQEIEGELSFIITFQCWFAPFFLEQSETCLACGMLNKCQG